jgi:hypothetical protein
VTDQAAPREYQPREGRDGVIDGAAGEGLQVDLEQAACLAAGEGNLHVTPAPEGNRRGCRIEHLASGHLALSCRGISALERSGLTPERNAAPVDLVRGLVPPPSSTGRVHFACAPSFRRLTGIRRADRVLAVSAFASRDLAAAYGVPAPQVICNGVERDRSRCWAPPGRGPVTGSTQQPGRGGATTPFPQVSLGSGGEAITTWSGNPVQAAVRPRQNAAWQRPVRLGFGGVSEVAVGPSRQGMVVWQRPASGSAGTLIQAASYTPPRRRAA